MTNPRTLFRKACQITAGSAIYAAGFQFFAYPNAVPGGGIGGVAMIVNYLSGLPVGVMTMLLNIPLFVVALRHFGWKFLVSSFAGMILSSVCIDLLSLTGFVATHEILLSAIYGGVLEGLGLGLVFAAGASTGGSDILAWLLRKRLPQYNLGSFVLFLDVIVVAAFAVIFSRLDSAMYAMILMYISSKVIDLVLYGASNSKICYVISHDPDTMAKQLMDRLGRGVTFLKGAGAYSGQERDIVMCVIRSRQIAALKQLVEEIDSQSFLVCTDAGEVFGEGFSDLGKEGGL